MKTVLVGCGNISMVWMKAITNIPEIIIVGLVDRIKNKAESLANTFNCDAVVGTELEPIIKQTQAEMVFDCTNPESRVSIAKIAFECSCHLLVEKPLAPTIEDALKIISLQNGSGKWGGTMQNHRFNPTLRNIRQFLNNGTLGDLTQISSLFSVPATFTDFRASLPHVLLLDMAIHTFDAIRFLSSNEPIKVFCREWNPPGSTFERDAAAIAVFNFENQLLYTYQGNWCSKGLRTPWESEWRISGTNGTLFWDGAQDIKIEKWNNDLNRLELDKNAGSLVFANDKSGHEFAIKEFLHSVLHNKEPETSFRRNFASLQMVHNCIISAELNESVDFC